MAVATYKNDWLKFMPIFTSFLGLCGPVITAKEILSSGTFISARKLLLVKGVSKFCGANSICIDTLRNCLVKTIWICLNMACSR